MEPDIVITGWWGSEPIWRKRTAAEKLAYELEKIEEKRRCPDCKKLNCSCDHDRRDWEEREDNSTLL